MPRSEALRQRGRLNALQRHRAADDPEILNARRDLAAERLAEQMRTVISSAPPLTAGQKARLAAILGPIPPAALGGDAA